MKKLVAALVVMFSLVAFSPQAFACGPVITGGQADIPYWIYYWGSSSAYIVTTFYVTNRSEKAVDATLSLRYDSDGQPVTLDIVRIGVSGGYQSAANATATIPAYGQESFYLIGVSQNPTIRGSGTLSWEFTDQSTCDYCKPIAVVVKERESGSNDFSRMGIYQVLVNGDTWF